jgi:hypothetical protein
MLVSCNIGLVPHKETFRVAQADSRFLLEVPAGFGCSMILCRSSLVSYTVT